jgi:Uma2 family endonuclease
MVLAYQEYYTIEDYQRWQGDWELIEGMPYAMTPSPSVTHQIVSGNIFAELKFAARNNSKYCEHCHILMETDWQISNDTVVRPDIMLVCKAVGESISVTPDLIIEVVSSTSTKRDEEMKFKLYHREGVPYYILVYPEKNLAKTYINRANGFCKMADYTEAVAEFDVGGCRVTIDFGKVWRSRR